jgi:hypothetical protein
MTRSFSPVLSRRRPRRPPRPSRAGRRPPQPTVMMGIRSRMPAIRSALVVTAVFWSIATGVYFAFRDDVRSSLIGRQTEVQIPYEDLVSELRVQADRIISAQQIEQRLNTLLQRQAMLEQRTSALPGVLSTTGTIKTASIASPQATPAEEPTPMPPINDTLPFVGPEREVRLPELRASATTKHHRIHRVASQRASRGRSAPPSAAASIAPPQATAAEKPDSGIANQ